MADICIYIKTEEKKQTSILRFKHYTTNFFFLLKTIHPNRSIFPLHTFNGFFFCVYYPSIRGRKSNLYVYLSGNTIHHFILHLYGAYSRNTMPGILIRRIIACLSRCTFANGHHQSGANQSIPAVRYKSFLRVQS